MSSSSDSNNNKLQRIIAIVALLYLVVLGGFTWGYLSFKNKSFPHQLITDMQGSIKSIEAQRKLRDALNSAHDIIKPDAVGGVTVNKLTEGQDDLIFVTWFDGGLFVTDLIDRAGNVVYSWRIPHDKVDMTEAIDRAVILMIRNQTIHGAHLSPNGDVLFVNEYRGLVKLSHDSQLLWRTKEANHHAVTVGPDGTIWALDRRQVDNEDEWVDLARWPYMDDLVVSYTQEGELIDRFSIVELLVDNGYDGILYGGPPFAPRLPHRDPLHVNDIDVITQEQAEFFPNVEAGDIMLSLRTPDTIIIVNPTTREIRWSVTGPFVRQHDPQVTRDGLLLIYDNRTVRAQLGGEGRYLDKGQALGYSRVIAIDPVTRGIRWEYSGTEEEPFFSSIQGKHEELPNGNVMVVEPEGGRIFEVDRDSGEIVWEYVNLMKPGYVGRITQAIPFRREDLPFLDNVSAATE